MDKFKHIKNLLEKYWAVETSPEEEKILRDFFVHTPDVPPHLQAYAELFIVQDEQHNIQLPDNFEEKLLKKLRHGKRTPFTHHSSLITHHSFFFTKIAAGVVILLSIGLLTYQRIERRQTQLAAATEARETIINALTLIADNVQKGEAAINEGLKQFEILSTHEHE